MSLIEELYLLDRSAVPGLVEVAGAEPLGSTVSLVENYLQENDLGVLGGYYPWSGRALLFVLMILKDTGAPLGEAEYATESEAVDAAHPTTYLITSADKRHLAALDPARLDRAAAERYFGDEVEAARPAIDDGLILLRRLISALRDNEVLIVHIG